MNRQNPDDASRSTFKPAATDEALLSALGVSREQQPPPPASRGVLVFLFVILATLAAGLVASAFAMIRHTDFSGVPVADSAGAEPREVRTVDLGAGVTMDVVWIPPGRFLMGSRAAADGYHYRPETRSVKYEVPRHQVHISRGLWMGKYEVTNAQFRRFRPAHTSGEYRGFSLDGDTQPAVNVSWEDAVAFCNWMATQTGLAIRLPTEAEWEYACRAGGTTEFSPGEGLDSLKGYANVMNPSVAESFGASWLPFPWEDGSVVTSAVGGYKPNAWGLYDMHGNAWEWCNDWFERGYYARSPERDPMGPRSGESRVLRGGSWSDTPWYCRSAYRNARLPGASRVYDGFRIAISARAGQPAL